MMKFLCISALLLSCAAAAARDPFAPPSPPCASSAASLASWQLQGLIGRDNHYIGWLRSVQGETLVVAQDRPSPFAGWRIEALTPFRLTLSAPPGCIPQQATLQMED